MKNSKLDIYMYTDFRVFIRDRLDEAKTQNSKFSRRYFCHKVGVSSTNYLKRIIDGSRDLSDDLAQRLSSVMGLDREEKVFFYHLVRYGQAKTTEAKREALEILQRNKRFRDAHKMDLEHYKYMTDCIALALREMISCDGFENDPAWIAERMVLGAKSKDIEAAFERLESLGLMEKDAGGMPVQAHKHQSTGEAFGAVTLRTYHRNMLRLAEASIEQPVDQRHFRGLTFSVPQDCYGDIVEQLSIFIEKIRAIIADRDDCDQVYHLEMALFPLAKSSNKKNGRS